MVNRPKSNQFQVKLAIEFPTASNFEFKVSSYVCTCTMNVSRALFSFSYRKGQIRIQGLFSPKFGFKKLQFEIIAVTFFCAMLLYVNSNL